MSQRETCLTDEQLMLRAQQDEPHRFGELIRRHRTAMLNVAQQRLGNRAWAEDAVQETFLAAFKARHTFNPQYRLQTWLWTILLNQCKRLWAKQQTSSNKESANTSLHPPTSPEAPEARLLAQERKELLQRLLQQIPTEQAAALQMRFWGGMKFQDIADSMGCTLLTAKNRVKFGLQKLSQLIPQHSHSLTDSER